MRLTATRIRCGLFARRTGITLTAWLSLVGLLAGCASAGGDAPVRAPAPGFPVTVTNCGVTTTYERPPERVVTMNQLATEIMLALGLRKHMVGTAYLDDKILPKYRDEYKQIPVLSDKYPSYEVLLKAAPDFVYAGMASAFDQQDGRSRQRLREAGINTRLHVEECARGRAGMDEVRNEIRTVGKIFGVGDRARRLVDTLDKRLAEVRRELGDIEPVSVFVYDNGTKVSHTVGGSGMANELIRLAGGSNVFADLSTDWADVSWEQVIKRDPQWIVIMDYGSTTVREKKRRLLNDPALADVTAIRRKNFAVLPLTSVMPGVRVPRGVSDLASQLHPGRFR